MSGLRADKRKGSERKVWPKIYKLLLGEMGGTGVGRLDWDGVVRPLSVLRYCRGNVYAKINGKSASLL